MTLQIEPTHFAMVKEILARYLPNYEVWAFGSRVKGTARPYSDLDLAVMGNTAMSIAQLAELSEAFSESDLPWRVDIVDWATTSERFREIIRQKYVVVQEK